jgi:hypothetical protein
MPGIFYGINRLKTSPWVLTYAQKPNGPLAVTPCCKATCGHRGIERKSLISLGVIVCSEVVQSDEKLDSSGFAGIWTEFSTKLSTIFWDDSQSPFKSST